jgi:hypothetical protein
MEHAPVGTASGKCKRFQKYAINWAGYICADQLLAYVIMNRMNNFVENSEYWNLQILVSASCPLQAKIQDKEGIPPVSPADLANA